MSEETYTRVFVVETAMLRDEKPDSDELRVGGVFTDVREAAKAALAYLSDDGYDAKGISVNRIACYFEDAEFGHLKFATEPTLDSTGVYGRYARISATTLDYKEDG